MQNLFVETFNGVKINSFIWNGRACWIGIEVAKLLGYSKFSSTIGNCIVAENFKVGKEYEILEGTNLKEFKKIIGESLDSSVRYAPKITIFFEEGLYGFLAYTEKPLGVTFRTWIREEVVPQIRATGAYVLDDDYYNKTYNSSIEFTCIKDTNEENIKENSKVIVKDNNLHISSKISLNSKSVVEKIADNVIIFDKYLEGLTIADEDKFLFLVSLYKSANIDIDLSFINSSRG